MIGNDKLVAMRRAAKLCDWNFAIDVDCQCKLASCFFIQPLGRSGQRVNVRRPIMIEIKRLVVGHLDTLLSIGGNWEHSHFKTFVVDLLEQPRISFRLFITFVDLSSSFFFNHLADHLLAVDHHAKVTNTAAAWNGERIQSLDNSVFGIQKNLVDFGHGDSVVDRNPDILLFDLKNTAEPAVSNQQPGAVGLGNRATDPDQTSYRDQAHCQNSKRT